LNSASDIKQDIYLQLARGMGLDLHWFPEDVPVSQLAATLVGMANTAGGTVFLGIAPRSGHVHGVEDIVQARDKVFQAALLADPPLVLPIPDVHAVGEEEVLSITVPKGLPGIYSLEGRYLWRDGSQTNPIPPRQLRRMLVERGAVQFESRLPPEASLKDLDPEKVRAYAQIYLERVGRSTADRASKEAEIGAQEILVQRGCLRQEKGEFKPTYAALLLFGNQPQRWLPTSSILAARFSGIAFGDRFVKQEISGTLPDQLLQVESFIRANLQKVVRLVGLTHQESLEYPFEAVRELLVNAVAHRDYNIQGDEIHLNIFMDRLEVISPGRLPGPMTLENLLEARFSRNPVIVQMLSDLGFVERLGYGLDRVVSILRQNNMPAPRFEEIAGTFRVTLFAAKEPDKRLPDLGRYRGMNLNPRQESALNYLAMNRRITNRDYQELSPDVHPETLRRDLADLVERGILLKIGNKRATYYILKKID
jgi:ATP-dependent DNA helicase RecG